MSKYRFYRMGGTTFQEMVQSLLEARRRGVGELTQFTSQGADGAREATWIQPTTHPEYHRPESSDVDIPKLWVFQVKFHDIGSRGWSGASSALLADLDTELEKVTSKYKLDCHHYVMITNVPLTGGSGVGTRDKATKVCARWKTQIPNVEIWDAADLSRMLDNNPEVRASYAELILPGDVLTALYRENCLNLNLRESSLRGYLKHLIDHESKARAEEAGDDEPLPLHKVFIDQTLKLNKQNISPSSLDTLALWELDANAQSDMLPNDLENVPCGFPLLWGEQEKVMLLAGPGYGKSTITQFLALYHAGRIIDRGFASTLAQRLKLPAGWDVDKLDSFCKVRFPFRIELRRYSKWCKSQTAETNQPSISAYIARQLIASVVESNINSEDIFCLISSNPALLILDGLDEVPNKEDRDAILRDCEAFLYRCSGSNVDLQVVMSSRPQGYHGEFEPRR